MRYADGYAYRLDVSPGNGTRYRLIVAIVDGCYACIAWPDLRWSCGDFAQHPPGAEWLGAHGLGDADALAVAAILQTFDNGGDPGGKEIP